MAFCSYCGTKLEENAKFCTACGAQAEPAPVQSVLSQEPEAAPQTESETIQGSYTAPAQGTYTAPAQGSYTAPQQDAYTPVNSYTPPVQTPTSAAADSGSYVPPAQGYAPGGNYAPKAKAKMPKMPAASGGKKRLLMFGGIALGVILLIALVASCGKDKPAVIDGPQLDDPGVAIESSGIEEQWDGTWYGVMYVYEAEGDFAGIPSDVYDTYMVVDVDDAGSGTMEVYFAGVDEPYATAECEAKDYGMDVLSGSIVDMVDMDTYNWMFRPVPDYPDRYTITDHIEYDDSLFEYTLFFKQWGKSWQDEIEGDEILPPSVEEYEAAIAKGELPPVGFAPVGYGNGGGASASAVVESPSVWYGWVSFTEFENIDSDDLMYDAWAFVEEDDDGNTSIRIHQDGYPDTPLMFMYTDIKGNKVVPAIGYEDAWVSDTYLMEENSDMYEGVLGTDGVLRFDYFFTHYDGEYGYRIQMNFRVDGTQWDEDNDILPPRYDEYKAALSGGAESQPEQQTAPTESSAPAQSTSGPSGFGGEHTATLAEFMTDIPADFTFTLPESGWVLDVYSDSTIYMYNVPTLDDAYSDSPRIQFELKENLDKINFYKDKFENLKEIDSRTIGGIEMTGRTYKNVGMYWTEYYGELPNGIWVTCKISDVDISEGTEGDIILDSVKIS